jgi:uncharacterized protein (DUF433 family)/DNA-binding transcriptional MerR regulator
MAVRELPPRGHYLADEVGRLAGVSGQRIGQWARFGYIRSSRSEETPRIYSYQDVAEAMVVHALVEAGVEYDVLRATIQALRERYGHDWPLQKARLKVPADQEGAERPSRKRTVVAEGVDLPVDHPVLTEQGLVEIATDLRRGGWAARSIPDLDYVEVNPDRLSGRPVIRGTRIPAEHVGRIANRTGGHRILRRDYDLSDEQIESARRWWEVVHEYETQAV